MRYPLPRPFEMPRGRDDEPIGRALRAAGRGLRDAATLVVAMQQRCSLAFGMRLGDRSLEVLRDPVGAFLDAPGGEGLTREEAERWLDELRALPGREAALRAVEDACAVGADATVEVVKELLRRRAARGRGTSRRP
jgi:hypothetical protein